EHLPRDRRRLRAALTLPIQTGAVERMAAWEYRRVVAMSPSRSKVKRDADGLYADQSYFRLDPNDGWTEGKEFLWWDWLAFDQETQFWRREVDVLNHLGRQGWEVVTTHVVEAVAPPLEADVVSGDRLIYVLKRPVS